MSRTGEPASRETPVPRPFRAAHTLAAGALAFLAYAIAQVVLNGVTLDEAVIAAQIITGAVSYPAGHPHGAYYAKVYSLLHYVAAGLWKLMPDAARVSAVFDVLFLFVSAFVPFALAAVLARSAAWGYAAAALAVLGSMVRFRGFYPIFVFPDYFSNGQVGLLLALLVPALMFARTWRTAGLLLGLLPAIHAVMAAVVWPWAALYVSRAGDRPDAAGRRRMAAGLAAGLAVCAGLAAVIALQAVPAAAPPYDVRGNADLIYRHFTELTDTHRRPFILWSTGYLATPALFLGLAGLVATGARGRSDPEERRLGSHASWLLLFGLIVLGAVYGAALLSAVTGSMPRPIQIAMPWRLSNLLAWLLVPLTTAALAQSADALPERQRAALLGLAVLALAGGAVLVRSHPGILRNNLLIGLASLAFAARFVATGGKAALRFAVAGAVGVGGVLVSFIGITKMGVYFLAGIAGGWLVLRGAARFPWLREPIVRPMLPLAAALAAAAALIWPLGTAPFARTQAFDRELSAWLSSNAGPDDLILPVVEPWTILQLKTRHPVLFHWETLYLMAYQTDRADVIGMMAKDLYGVDYADADRLRGVCENGRLNQWCPVWVAAWRERSRSEWQALGAKYALRWVLAPSDTRLDLPVALDGEDWTLYRIPARSPPEPGS